MKDLPRFLLISHMTTIWGSFACFCAVKSFNKAKDDDPFSDITSCVAGCMLTPNMCALFPQKNTSVVFSNSGPHSGKRSERYALYALKCKKIWVMHQTISQPHKVCDWKVHDTEIWYFLTASSMWPQSVFLALKPQTSMSCKWCEERTDLRRLCNGQKQHSDGRAIKSIWCEHHSIAHHMENQPQSCSKGRITFGAKKLNKWALGPIMTFYLNPVWWFLYKASAFRLRTYAYNGF